jgi:RNA polymerase sigma factor (sigma-70 family)
MNLGDEIPPSSRPAHDPEGTDRGATPAKPAMGEAHDQMAGAIEPLLGYLAAVARKLMAGDNAGLEGASDLVQITVVAALEGIAKGQAPRAAEGELKAWLRGIMLNVRHGSGRRKDPARDRVIDQVPADTSSPSSKASRDELIDRMAQARSRLGERDRQILDWKHRDELTLQAIGDQLGVSAVAAHKAYHRALGRLENAFLESAAASAYQQTRGRLRSVYRNTES